MFSTKIKRVQLMLLAMLIVLAGVPVTASASSGVEPRFYVDRYYSEALGKEMTYRVYLPDGYYEDNQKYPTVYMLHQEDSSSVQFENDKLNEELDRFIAEGTIQKMIVVMPDTSGDSWFVNQGDDHWEDMLVNDLIPVIDDRYHTIASPKYRGISGVSMGGYGAFVLGLKHPELFSSIASHMGALGNKVSDLKPMELIKARTAAQLRAYQYYFDGGTDDPLTYAADSTNDIHAQFRGTSIAHGYQTRPGGHSSDYYLTYLNRSFMMHSSNFSNGLLSGSFKASPQAIQLGDSQVKVDFTANLNRTAVTNSVYTNPNNFDFHLQVLLKVENPKGDTVYTKQTTLGNVVTGSSLSSFTGSFDIPVAALGADRNYNVSLDARLLGTTFSLGKRPLIKITPTGTLPEDTQIDLLGDWLFIKDNYPVAAIDGTNPQLDRSAWRTVQPGLDWWTDGFGDYSGLNNYVGAAWYYKEFDVPADFPEKDLTLLAGKLDDADQTYINGQLVGETGFKDGVYTASFWAASRTYAIPSNLLKRGEKNTIAIRLYNQSGGGGWYAGPVGIYSKAALQKANELPSNVPGQAVVNEVNALAQQQFNAIAKMDLQAYRNTLSNSYFENGFGKLDLLNQKAKWMADYESIETVISAPYVFERDGHYLYSAQAEIIGTLADDTKVTLQQGEIAQYYSYENGLLKETGNQKLFFIKHFYSESAQRDVKFRVYLPKSYLTEPNKRYPSIYLLHQFNSDSESYEIDKVDQILDKGIAAGDIKDMIVVMPDSSGSSWWVNGTGEAGVKWQDMVTKDLVPYIDGAYRTIDDARYRGTSGVSMGGFGSFVIGLQYPDLFSTVVSHMGALNTTNTGQNPITIAKSYPIDALKRYSIYFDSGNLDVYRFDVPVNTLHKYLVDNGVEHYSEIRDGAHDSVFYTATIGKSFAQHSRHFKNANVQTDVLQGKLSVVKDNEGAAVSYEVAVTEALAAYEDHIPTSPYLKEANPKLNIPVVVDVYNSKTNERLYSKTEYMSSDATALLEGGLALPKLADGSYKVVLRASVLDQSIVLSSADYTVGSSTDGNTDGSTGGGGTVIQPEKTGEQIAASKSQLVQAIDNKQPLKLTASNGSTLEIPLETLVQISQSADIATIDSLIWKVTPVVDAARTAAIQKAESALGGKLQSAGEFADFTLSVIRNDKSTQVLNLAFAKPVKLQLKVTAGTDTELAGVYYWNAAGNPELIASTYDQATGTFTAELSHFSMYSVMVFTKSFTDIPAAHWAKRAIEVLASKQIVSGTTRDEFAPNRQVTRAEFAALLVRSLGLKEQAGSVNPFADVSESSWYHSAVVTAYQNGIIKGSSKDRFSPLATITREEMAVMIFNAYQVNHQADAVNDVDLLGRFKDSGQIHKWAANELRFAVQMKLIQGKDDVTLAPLATATRAEAAQIIYNLTTSINTK
ncbi:alpha/beta hydrolase-fold protein [Paenibacillus sinopodophylli]|uniref:alpha/beta hydrolase-fold protein n=1 Tax=Paenibacillus sinopodophylli TaxID=1837342 RepID=UPI001FE809EB|nr:alpha/beta hydrolase-fold protein [Paenibacillus sinopodophylli]